MNGLTMDWMNALQKEIEAFPGTAGVVVRSSSDGVEVSHNAGKIFSSASLIKLGVLFTLFSKVSSGEIDLDEYVLFDHSVSVEGGLLHRVRSGANLRLDDLAVLMIAVSDNTAANILIDRLGIDEINSTVHGLGLVDTILGRKMLDFEAKKRGKDNFTTSGDVSALLEEMHSGSSLPLSLRERIMEILSLQKLNFKLPGLIPVLDVDDVEQFLAHKTGELPGNEHDAGIFFYHRKKPVIVSVMTEGLQDRSEGVNFCARIGRIFYDAFCDQQ
ncbi:MAG: serine hydrolase [Synergistaceae bacterium]|nr:serine hydrolase [Synergistaceae bacterium]